MTHPCADHPCDHCYLCDVVGICCQTVPTAARIQTDNRDAALLAAILAELREVADLTALIRTDDAKKGWDASAAPLVLPSPLPVPPLPVRQHTKGVRR